MMKSLPEAASARVIKSGAGVSIHPYLTLQPNGHFGEMKTDAEEVDGEEVVPAIEEATFFPGEDPAADRSTSVGAAAGEAAGNGIGTTEGTGAAGTAGITGTDKAFQEIGGEIGAGPASAGTVSIGNETAGTQTSGSVRESEAILEEARAEAESIREEARKQGYEAGYQEGVEAGQAAAEQAYKDAARELQEQTAKLLSEIDSARDDILKEHLGTLRDIAIAVGEKVIQISLSSSGEVIRRMIETEAEKHKKTAWVKIYIDRADYSMAVETSDEAADVLSKLSDDIQFVVLDHKPRGYLIMETPEEIVDLSTATQIDNIKNKLKEITIEDEDIHVPADS